MTKLLLLAGLLAACVVPEASASPAAVKQASVEGALDKTAVREVVKQHIDEIRDCYDAELAEDETVEGRVVVSFVAQADGSVSTASMPESTMPPRFDACVLAAVETWTFPTAEAETTVWYPFLLSPG